MVAPCYRSAPAGFNLTGADPDRAAAPTESLDETLPKPP